MMRRTVCIVALLAVAVSLPSCEGCVRKASKKATELALSAAEGVAEALDEHGERVGEKATDALGAIAKGAGSGIGRLLDEHAGDVAATAGRTLVQSLDGLESGIATEYYDKMEHVSVAAPDGVVATVEFLGKISDNPVVDTYLIIENAGTFGIDFVFEDAEGARLMKKTTEAVTEGGANRYTVVSFALTDDELTKWAETGSVKIEITSKPAI